jgi:hypothetical protein
MASNTPSITTWNRIEPRPRSAQFGPSLAAQVRDPAWFLCRQWQTGEFAGQDAGSPAFLTVATTTSDMVSWRAGNTSKAMDSHAPLEKQLLAEPFSSKDLSLSVEIGQVFRTMVTSDIYELFLEQFPLTAPDPPQTMDFNPRDAETRGFLAVCAGLALDGAAVYALAKQYHATPTMSLPAWILAAMVGPVKTALGSLYDWVQAVWGEVSDDDVDPPGWVAERLEYRLQVQAQAPDGSGLGLDTHPDALGELPWSSFDVSADAIAPPPSSTVDQHRLTMIPGHVRFRCMPAPRFWDFETSDIALPNVRPEPRDVGKILTLDFLLIHGADWFIAPIAQELGKLARVDNVVVTDVFGVQTSIDRGDKNTRSPGPTRWTLFTPVTPTTVGDFFVSSPSAGNAVRAGRPLESVRFARDDMANMAWGIENATASLIGRPRPGAERDAAVDAIAPVLPAPSTDTTSPLRYQVETKVPIHWIPLLGDGNPVTHLRVAAMVRPDGESPPTFLPVAPTGKILQPGGSSTYLLADEEVPRDGVVVERVPYRCRWTDGSSHLWLARRRRTGAGETASALRFDVASLTKS